jgi:hypothetical protein
MLYNIPVSLYVTAWKEPIKLLELSAIGVAVLTVALHILPAFIERYTRNYVILLLIRMMTLSSIFGTGKTMSTFSI